MARAKQNDTIRGINAEKADEVYRLADNALASLNGLRRMTRNEDSARYARDISENLELIRRRTDPEARR